MDARLEAINIMRRRLDAKLQAYWSEMFQLAYFRSLTAARRANDIHAHGHKLIALCVQINLMKPSAANHLHKAWDAAKEKHQEMRHCRDAKVIHPRIPETDCAGVLAYFTKGAENKCNCLLMGVRALQDAHDSHRLDLLHELQETIECAKDLELIPESKLSEVYQTMNEYWHQNYTTETIGFT